MIVVYQITGNASDSDAVTVDNGSHRHVLPILIVLSLVVVFLVIAFCIAWKKLKQNEQKFRQVWDKKLQLLLTMLLIYDKFTFTFLFLLLLLLMFSNNLFSLLLFPSSLFLPLSCFRKLSVLSLASIPPDIRSLGKYPGVMLAQGHTPVIFYHRKQPALNLLQGEEKVAFCE